jgi:EmrB/QacA subfamily drug resistance transporter
MASLNVALPDIARDTHASQTELVWVVDAYSLAFAALLLPAGGIGDRFGRRIALILGLGIFGIGSAVAMTASSASELIGLRAVIGAGAALVMPATLSTITSTFPAAARTRAVSIWAGVAGGAAVLGLVTSGALLAAFSWRSVFGLNVVLAAAAAVGTIRFVPESADPDAPRLDLGGAMIAALGLLALVFSVIEAPSHGWLAGRTLAGFGLALVLLVVFVTWELRHRAPLLDPRVFRTPSLSAGSLSISVQFLAFFGYVFTILQYLQLVRRDTPLLAAVQVLPMAAAMMPVSRLAPRLTTRFGTRRVCAAGLTAIAGGMVIMAQLGTHTSYWLMVAGLLVIGVGMGAAMTPATSAITEALPPAQQGVGSAINDLAREVGGAIGIAVIGSVLTAAYQSRVDLTGLPSRVAHAVKGSFPLASHLSAPIAQRADAGFVSAMHIALLTAGGAALLAAIAVTLLLGRRTGAGAVELTSGGLLSAADDGGDSHTGDSDRDRGRRSLLVA